MQCSHNPCPFLCHFLFVPSVVSLLEESFPSMFSRSLEHHVWSDMKMPVGSQALQTQRGPNRMNHFLPHTVPSPTRPEAPATQTLRVRSLLSSLALSRHPHVLDLVFGTNILTPLPLLFWPGLEPARRSIHSTHEVSNASLVLQKLPVAFQI